MSGMRGICIRSGDFSSVTVDSGKPLVKMSAIPREGSTVMRRLGFMRGQLSVPEDFDRMGGDEIVNLFAAALSEDPFNRILVAQATEEGITLVTADSVMAACPGAIELF